MSNSPSMNQGSPGLGRPMEGLAVTSLILGILSYLCLVGPILSVPGIITGHMALSRIRQYPDDLRGRGLALAGLVLGYLNVVVFVALAVGAGFWVAALVEEASPGRGFLFSGPRSSAQRASCQNNLKQWGLVFKMYANESKDEMFPELSSDPGMLMFSNQGGVYPNYCTDLSILSCPVAFRGAVMDDHSYFYLGYVVTNDEEMAAFVEAYKQRMDEGLAFDEDLPVPPGKVPGDTLYRLREGVERDVSRPAGGRLSQSTIPVMIERTGHHVPEGANVLYMDGHVEYLPYPGKWPMTEETITLLESMDDW